MHVHTCPCQARAAWLSGHMPTARCRPGCPHLSWLSSGSLPHPSHLGLVARKRPKGCVLFCVVCAHGHLRIAAHMCRDARGGLPALAELVSRDPHSSRSFHNILTLVCFIIKRKNLVISLPPVSFFSFTLSATLKFSPHPFADNLLEIPVQLVKAKHRGAEDGVAQPSGEWGALPTVFSCCFSRHDAARNDILGPCLFLRCFPYLVFQKLLH